MKQTPAFIPPVLDSTQSKVNMELYDRSIDCYNEGKYRESFYLLLDHLDPDFRVKYGNPEGTEFHIPHGSVLVNIRIADNRISIVTDFLELPEKGRVAMLRQIADINLNYLLLPYFRREGDKLKIEYSCPLSQSHPHKMYIVLRNICHTGDRYDDEFCTKFGAKRCYEPKVTPFPPEESERICEAIYVTCRETLDMVKEYESERKYGYAWNVLDIAFYKIAYFAYPQGQLRNDLEKIVYDMDKDLPVAELVSKGKAFLEKLLAMPAEEIKKELYFVDILVSARRCSSLKNVQENFVDTYKEAAEAMQAGNYERSAVRLLYKFYEMYFYNDVQDDLNAVIVKALKKSSGKSVEEASEILFDAMDKIMDGELDGDWEDLLETPEVEEGVAQQVEQMQEMAASMQSQVLEMQTKMQEAMARGDMAEYMRLATEFQQKVMEQAMGKQE